MSMTLLENISIILVRTKTPANIGAVARCMMNTGLSRLVLVQPKDHLSEDARKLAAGADRILESAQVFQSLAEAVAGHNLVVGTSGQAGKRWKNVRTARDMAGHVAPLLGSNRTAIVFGREVNGLEQQELALCHELIAIPSHHDFPSLNLSHAVMIVAYELFLASGAALARQAPELAPAGELETLYLRMQTTLARVGFLHSENTEHMMQSLRQLFGRASLESRDVRILQGILTEVERNIQGAGKP
ncbi:MAG: hypothetical protein A2X56_05005 [Nitrospirae bacterium GWC2_57_13]|nr:MAG: hypothetical protein A2072_08055 [Nitrospirae bacterium GWC1_57_7]OGW27251.1 MAG: hypothetical protein A2X56_05005 [Nitrospirae bacterium GWC2_57_13]OGW44570.1 MAG: hypothetical protein A2X57_05065 [Nitrospirae bacterium GWD2_57_8]